MSKMGNLNLQLQEQLADLGFKDLEEAELNGYAVDYFALEKTAKLVKRDKERKQTF